jgi:hypothetical protein
MRVIPAIKCVNGDAAAACRSFKELVAARDSQLLREVLGEPGHPHRHIAYVCFRPKTDVFSLIEFDIPDSKEYRPPSTLNEDIARYSDDAVPTNRGMRESDESLKQMLENTEFFDFSDPPAVSSSTKEKWFQDHSKGFVYATGSVFDFRYQNGIEMGPKSEIGEWSTLAGSSRAKIDESPDWFVGGYAWIERFNRQHGDAAARDDNPEQGHISVDPSSIEVHYKFKNPSENMVDYTLQIHRLTGRFVESFRFPEGNDEMSGTCMIFK